MTRGQVAEYLRINSETLRYYEKIKLIDPKHDKSNGYRYYDENIISKLELIISFKNLGFSLKEIREFFELIKTSTENPNRFNEYLTDKVSELNKQIQKIILVKDQLEKFKNKEDKETCELFSKFIS